MPTAGTGSGGDGASAWVIPGLFAADLALATGLWLGGGLASLWHRGSWPSATWSPMLPLTALRDGSYDLWPGVPSSQVWAAGVAVTVLLLAPLALLALRWASRRARSGSALRSLATGGHVRAMTQQAAEETARRLRPSLRSAKRGLPPGEIGLRIGELLPRGPKLYCSWEDVMIAVMAPRAGKTTALAVPAILDAPGSVVATSNKADLWASTAALRRRGKVWVFDPQNITKTPQTWWWNPLRSIETVEDADRFAASFVLTVDDAKAKDVWGPAAQELLAGLFMAAKHSGKTIHDVYEWLQDSSNTAPITLLKAAGQTALAASLEGFRSSPEETRGSVYFTARVAARCLRNPAITRWVSPPDPGSFLDEFDPARFPTASETLYLLSKDGGGSAAPFVAALTDRLMRCATTAAEACGGRLDPPMVVVLDEAANICKIGDLPELYSHLGSRGVVPVTILQSYSQGTRVWGDAGMKALWSAATVKIIGSGIDDPSFAEDLSRLVGEHEVRTVSRNSGGGRASHTTSTRRQRILPAADIRELAKGQALVLATGTKPALVRTLPWYEGPHRESVTAAVDSATQRITAAAATGAA